MHEILEVEGLCRPGPGARQVPDLAGVEGIAYPEWDYGRGGYRPGYCVLRELVAPVGDGQWAARVRHEHQALIRGLRRRFASLRPARQRCTWQLDGHELDIDAYVDDCAAGLAGGTFTRLGTPIRHLTALLARQRTRLRLPILVSDGKPHDEDGYEGVYRIEDTRQAVAEARVQGVTLFCLTIDRYGSSYLPQMFGPHGCAVLWEVTQLPQRLADLYRRLTTAP